MVSCVIDAIFDPSAAPGQKAASGSERPPQQAAGEDQPESEGQGLLLFLHLQRFFSASLCSFPARTHMLQCSIEATVRGKKKNRRLRE